MTPKRHRKTLSVTVKRNFQTYIRRYTSPNENFEYGYPHSNALLQFCLKLERCMSHNAACHPTKCAVKRELMTANCSFQYIAGYTIAIF